jgi:hypothetical protein
MNRPSAPSFGSGIDPKFATTRWPPTHSREPFEVGTCSRLPVGRTAYRRKKFRGAANENLKAQPRLDFFSH